jgi:hypothetical protein
MALLDLFRRRPKEAEEAQAFLLRFLNNRCLRQKFSVEEKRRETRTNLVVGVWIVPLVEGATVVGRAFPTVTKDFTTSGLGIVIDTPFTCEEVLVILYVERKEWFLRCKVLESIPIGAGFSVTGLHVLGLAAENEYPETVGLFTAGDR